MKYWIQIKIVIISMMTVVQGRRDLCDATAKQKYPCSVEFLADYVKHYSYNEIYIVIYNQDRKLLEAVARKLLKGKTEATTSVLRRTHAHRNDTGKHRDISDPSIHQIVSSDRAQLPKGFPDVSISRRPVFVTTAGAILELQDAFDWTVGEASRYHPWLVICRDLSPLQSEDHYFPLDNQVTLATWKNHSLGDLVHVDIWEAYQAAPNFVKKTSREGFWSNFSLNLNSKEREGVAFSFPQADIAPRRNDLMGLHIRCLTESWQPFTDNVPTGGNKVTIGGVMGESFKLLSKALNFTYSCRQAPDREFGDENNGNWSGLVRELIDNKGDVIVAPLDKTCQRAQKIDFTLPSRTITYDLIIRRPEPNALANYTRILQPGAWLLYLLTVILTCILYVSFLLVKGTFDLRSLFDGAFAILSIHLNQTTVSIRSGGLSRRIFFLTTIMTAWLVLEFYMSDLVSFLAVPVTETPFSNIAELLTKGGYRLALQKGNSEVERFRNATDDILKRVWSDIVIRDPSNIVSSAKEGLERVRDESYVFLTDVNYVKFHESYDCSVMAVGTEMFKYGVGMAVQKGSPLLQTLDYHILRQQASGIIDRYWEMYKAPDADCQKISTTALGLRPLMAAFVAFLLGFVISVVIFAVEYFRVPDEDSEGRRFGPEDNRLMYAPFKDALKMLGYTFDREKGISYCNEWEDDEILSLLLTYRKMRPKISDPYSMTPRQWRKIGASIDKEPKICEIKFKELLQRYFRYRICDNSEEWNLKQATYFFILQEIVYNDRSLLESRQKSQEEDSIIIEDFDLIENSTLPDDSGMSSSSLPGSLSSRSSDFPSFEPSPQSHLSRAEERTRTSQRPKKSKNLRKTFFPRDK